MGGDLSKYDTTLHSPNTPIVTIDKRYVKPHEVTLLMRQKFWFQDDFCIKDFDDKTVYFKIDQSSYGISEKRTLLDCNGKPVANFKHRPFDWSFDVFRGPSSSDYAFSIIADFALGGHKFSAPIVNKVTGQQQLLYIRSDPCSLDLVIFNGRPKDGGRAIAKVERQSFILPDSYVVKIAPGVDLAMIVFICLAFDEARDVK